MKKQTTLKILFLSLALSSCGLIEKFKTPEESSDFKDSSTAATDEASTSSEDPLDKTDDLFENVAESSSETTPVGEAAKEAPEKIGDDLKSLEDEFASSAITSVPPAKEEELKKSPPPESIPEIKNEVVFTDENEPATASESLSSHNAGAVEHYTVKKGETLMQIAFKIYGDLSKWKELKEMNSDKLNSGSALKTNTQLKYHAPAKRFVWNPSGTPHLIKNGETLGTISNSVYGTPRKWKNIWENNKPLVKNPNVIYAGFTLYYQQGGMANFVQPEEFQAQKEITKEEYRAETIKEVAIVEEKMKPEVKLINKFADGKEELEDESIQILSAPERVTDKTMEIASEKSTITTEDSISTDEELEDGDIESL